MATAQVLVRGSGWPNVQRLAQLEQSQPEGTRMAWRMQFHDVTIGPTQLGPVHLDWTLVPAEQLASGTATVLNWLIPRMPQLQQMPRWPGEAQWAEAQGDTVTVRWVKGSAWSAALVGALAGLGTTLVAMGVFDLGLIPAVVLGALVALGVFAMLSLWELIAYVSQHPAAAAAPLLAWIGLGLIGLGLLDGLWHEL